MCFFLKPSPSRSVLFQSHSSSQWHDRCHGQTIHCAFVSPIPSVNMDVSNWIPPSGLHMCEWFPESLFVTLLPWWASSFLLFFFQVNLSIRSWMSSVFSPRNCSTAASFDNKRNNARNSRCLIDRCLKGRVKGHELGRNMWDNQRKKTQSEGEHSNHSQMLLLNPYGPVRNPAPELSDWEVVSI